MYEQPSFVVGKKAVFVRKINSRDRPDKDESVSIYVDNKEVGRFVFWGSYEGNSGYPFQDIDGASGELMIHKENEIVTFRKPYLTPSGKQVNFSYTLRSLGDSQVELSWSLGITKDEMNQSPKPFGVALWFTMDEGYREKGVRYGENNLLPSERNQLLDRGKISTDVTGDFALSPQQPLTGYSLLVGGRKGRVTESLVLDKLGNDRFGWITRFSELSGATEGRIVIDLGKGSLPGEDVPTPVAGYDLWKIDGIHFPASPVRNMMPNPSFEQGLRYWRWTGGGSQYTPSEEPRFTSVSGGIFGNMALRIHDHQSRSAGLQSFPILMEDGKTYTLSFYAKSDDTCSLSVALASAAKGGKFRGQHGIVFGDSDSPDARFQISTEWKRYSRTFTADGAGVTLILSGGNNTMIDGLQLEEGGQPSEFVSAPIDGNFMTNDADNAISKGHPIGAKFQFTGKPETRGIVSISIKNPYREVLYEKRLEVTIPESGVVVVPLDIKGENFSEGVFVVRTDVLVRGTPGYTDYYRFSIMDPLSNTHATKDIFGTITNYMARIGRGDAYGQKLQDWGFGSTSWGVSPNQLESGVLPSMEKKYGITNYFNTTINRREPEAKELLNYKSWTEVTPELEALIEEQSYRKVLLYNPEQYNTWHFGNEEESSFLPGSGKFDEYFKAQSAAARGTKRANPNAIFAPTNGTSGYNRLRGYDAVEGYLKAARNHNFKYDAVAVHPYGSIDKGTLSKSDLDEETARLIKQMGRYGYGQETPIFYTEMFNIPATFFPAWGAGPSHDKYGAGKLTYDFGNREYIQGASAARVWIIALKYWPHLRSTNLWVARPFIDYYFSPLVLNKVANTLGHHLPDVEFVGDIKPAAGVRGYSFRRKDGTGIAALWCIDHDVENGLKKGPSLGVTFNQPVEFYDLMGVQRSAAQDQRGTTSLPLTPAPLLIEAADVVALTKSLQAGELSEAASALAVSMKPDVEGQIVAKIHNLTGRAQYGTVEVAGQQLTYQLEPEQTKSMPVSGQKETVVCGKMYQWDEMISVRPQKGKGLDEMWNMDYFYVPKTNGMPDWNTTPAIEITNRSISEEFTGEVPKGDQHAQFRMAWDQKNLYLRVEVEDDRFIFDPEVWKRPQAENALWLNDGCLEVYFDTGADGRVNPEKTYDSNDYRYDFSIGKDGKSGPGQVNRFREVYHQLADGINMPSKEEVSEKVLCDFQITEKGYTYTIVFGQRYIEPLALKKGFMSGFAVYLHDRDNTETLGCPKGLSLSTEPGEACDYQPHHWPLMILTD